MDASRKLLWDKIKEMGLTPVSNEMRSECIIAPYVDMRISPKDYVTRFSVSIKKEK